jgi:hypothetical protein
MKAMVCILFALVCVLSAAIVIHRAELNELTMAKKVLASEVKTLELELANKDRRGNSQAKQLQEAREQLKIGNRTIDRLDEQIATARSQSKATAAASPEKQEDPADPQKAFMKAISEMMDQPDMKAMIQEQQRGQLESQYAAFFEEVGLDKTTESLVRELLLERLLAMAGLGTGFMTAMGDEDALKTLTDEMSELVEGFDDQIKKELGEDYQALKAYETTIQAREAIKLLQTRLGDERMDSSTQAVLLAVITEERAAAELNADLSDPAAMTRMAQAGEMAKMLEGMQDVNERVYERSSDFLTDKQLAALRSQQTMEASMLKMSVRMMDQTQEAKADKQ